jgi:hypothetical protein
VKVSPSNARNGRIGSEEVHMTKGALVIGTIAVTAMVAGGWALAQSVGPPGEFGPPFKRGMDGGMGPGMMKGMHRHGHDRMGPGTMKGMDGHWPSMKKGSGPAIREPEAALPDAASVRE